MGNKSFSRLFTSNIGIFLAIIFLFSLATFVMKNPWLAGAELLIWLGLTIYSFWYDNKKEKEMLEYVQTLAFHTETGTKETLLRFPMPLILTEPDGTILWYNQPFEKLSKQGVNLFDRKLGELLGEDFDMKKMLENNNAEGYTVNYGDKNFRMLSNVIETGQKEIFALVYLIDETKYVQIRKLYDDTRPVVYLVTIDNYDEVLQSTLEDNRATLLALIDKKIAEWAAIAGGFFKKIERDKYSIICEYKSHRQFAEGKYSILEEIKTINVGNRIPVTISVGAGIGGDSYAQNDALARNAIEMALGRGGDQAVIKDKNSTAFTYIGGNTKEVEKHTRVRTRVMAYALKQLISQSGNVIIMGHKNADFDSLGAAIGIHAACKYSGKSSYIIVGDMSKTAQKVVDNLKKKQEYASVFILASQAMEYVREDTLLIVVDVFRPSITECPELFEKTKNVVVLDHHRKTDDHIANASLTYHETYASSTSEMVTEMLQYIDEGSAFNAEIAMYLYAGISLDTKNFTSRTGVRTFEAAAYLRKCGVEPTAVQNLFREDFEAFEIKADIIKNAKIYKNNIIISKSSSAYSDIITIAAQTADELLKIENVEASFVICPAGEGVHISARSMGDINVQLVLEHIGGGGNLAASAVRLQENMESAEALLKTEIDKYLESR